MMNKTGAARSRRRSVTAVATRTRDRRWLTSSALGVAAAASSALLVGGLVAWLLRQTELSTTTVFLCVSLPLGLVAGAIAPIVQWRLARSVSDESHR
jgi:hypothetical protein